MWLTAVHKHILAELARGSRLQDHRTVDGVKLYQLHPLASAERETVPATAVEALIRGQLIQSNLKFPAATYLLTAKGVAVVAQNLPGQRPLSVKNCTTNQ